MLKTLIKSGLDESEAKVYLALLELGPSTVSEITRKAQITRTLGYHVLEKLGWYNLIDKVSGKNNKITYAPKHPQNLAQFIKNKKNSWNKKLQTIEKDLPNLVSLYKIAEKPTIKFKEGVSGIKNIANETLEAKKEILTILDIKEWQTTELKSFGKSWDRTRIEKKIKEKQLILDTPYARKWMKVFKRSDRFTEFRWIKREQLPNIDEFGGEINIYEDKVSMLFLKKPNQMGILIESSILSNLLKGLFELAWQTTKPIKPLAKKKKE